MLFKKSFNIWLTRSFIASILVLALIAALCGLHVAAASNLSNSYRASQPISPGSLVSLAPSSNGKQAVPADTENGSSLIGVAVAPNSSLLAVDSGKYQVQVAISGVADVAVSDINGPISVGDSVSVSPLAGAGMKAGNGARIVGVAQGSFGEASKSAKHSTIHNTDGQTQEVSIGFVPLAIGISGSDAGDSSGTNAYQHLISEIAGHNVSTVQASVAGAIVLVTLIAMIVLVGGTVRGSLVSVGRNPLAKKTILTTTAQILAMAAVLALLAVISLFFVLR